MNNVLVVAAHPDDEVLGCGATIAAHVEAGDRVHVLIVADGESARGAGDAAVEQRDAAARGAAEALGTAPPRLLRLPDNRLDSVPLLDIVQGIERVIDEVGPTVVYTHHAGDLNLDHALVSRAAMTACRPLPGSTVTAVYAFETPSSTEWAMPVPEQSFRPVRFVDVERTWERKLAALGCYESEMRAFPHARSYEAVQALAVLRGASAGLRMAEAFMVYRQVERPVPVLS